MNSNSSNNRNSKVNKFDINNNQLLMKEEQDK